MELLNIESLRVFLRAEEFLSDDDMEKLNPHPPHYVGSQIVETLVKIVRKKGQKGLEKFLSALKKSINAGNQPGHEEILDLFENEHKECSSTTQSAEISLPVLQEEVDGNDTQSNDRVMLLMQCNNDFEGCQDEQEGNSIALKVV